MRRALFGPLLLILFILLLAGWFPAWGAGNQPLSELQYWDLVESSRQAVVNLKPESSDAIGRGLAELAAQWGAVQAVVLSGGQTVPLDNSYLLSALNASHPDLDQIENILVGLKAAHQIYPVRVHTADDLQSLKAILARPEFSALNRPANPLTAWLQNAWKRLLDWISAWLQRLFGNRRVQLSAGSGSPLEILSIAVLLLVLIYAARSILADFISEAEWDENDGSADQALSADSAFERAQRLSRGGDYRSAVRYLYLSALLMLDERGLLRYDHAKTNREVLRSVSDSPELAQPLREVVEVFDNVWYGYHELDEDSFQHYSRRVEELKEKTK